MIDEATQHEISILLKERDRKVSLVEKYVKENPGVLIKPLFILMKASEPDFRFCALRTFNNYILSLVYEKRISVGPDGVHVMEAV